MKKLLSTACLALAGAGGAAVAQDQAAKKDEQPQQGGPQVRVTGTRADDKEARHISTASRLVLGREELDCNGDTTLGEVLKRLPGVTMNGAPGCEGGSVQMRGLGNGYIHRVGKPAAHRRQCARRRPAA